MALTVLTTFIQEDLYNWHFLHSQNMQAAWSCLNRINLTGMPTHIQQVQSIQEVPNPKCVLCTDDQCNTTVVACKSDTFTSSCITVDIEQQRPTTCMEFVFKGLAHWHKIHLSADEHCETCESYMCVSFKPPEHGLKGI